MAIRCRVLSIRFSDTEYQSLKAQAEQASTSVSVLARRLALGSVRLAPRLDQIERLLRASRAARCSSMSPSGWPRRSTVPRPARHRAETSEPDPCVSPGFHHCARTTFRKSYSGFRIFLCTNARIIAARPQHCLCHHQNRHTDACCRPIAVPTCRLRQSN